MRLFPDVKQNNINGVETRSNKDLNTNNIFKILSMIFINIKITCFLSISNIISIASSGKAMTANVKVEQ